MRPLVFLPLLASLFSVAPAPGLAQPSGGPYGPIEQAYEIPKAPHVYYVSPEGRPDAPGTTLEQPTTIEAAVARVVTGDAIVLRGGVYRVGGLELNQGITIQPYADERPILKGTRVADQWQPLRNNLWRTPWKTLFPAKPLGWWQRAREGMRTPLHRFNNDMVFVDGRMLRSAGWEGEVGPDSYFIDYDSGHVYIGLDPKDHVVEITAFDFALIRLARAVHGKESDRKGPTIRGITFTQYAFRALEVEGKTGAASPSEEPTNEPVGLSDPATYGKEVTGTTLENVTVTHCSRVAGYFRGDRLTIRNSLFSDTSTEGVYVIGSADVLLEKNIFRRNNVEQLTGYYPAAVKIFNQSHRVTCRDNLVVENPYSNGIWYDVGNRDGVFVNNWVEGAIDGFFFEISKGVTVAGNLFVRCDKGVRILNAAGARVYNNTFVDAPASFERNQRVASGDLFGWHAATGPGLEEREGHVFVNNLLVASESYTRPLLRFEQPAQMCQKLPRPQAAEVDGNVYARSAGQTGQPLIAWSPAATETCVATAASLAELRTIAPALEARGRQIDRGPASIFKGPAVGRYDLPQDLPGAARAASGSGTVAPGSGTVGAGSGTVGAGLRARALPPDVRALLGWTEQEAARTTGAYPVRR